RLHALDLVSGNVGLLCRRGPSAVEHVVGPGRDSDCRLYHPTSNLLRRDVGDFDGAAVLRRGILRDGNRADPLRRVVHTDDFCGECDGVGDRSSMRNLIVGFAWLAPFAAIVLWPHAPSAAIGVVALSHALLLYPTLRPNVQWLGPVFTRFETNAREVWLTIDDGPTDDTLALLELLARLRTTVTFFVKGELAERKRDVIQAITRGGHSIGN